jgi:hypothetical protein
MNNNAVIAIIISFLFIWFISPALGVFFGMMSGWIVSLMGLEPVVLTGLSHFGVNITGLSLWQVGGMLGFIGSFFRSSSSSSYKKEQN